MASRVTVSNLALSKLGEDFKLTDPGDPEKPARAIAACWDVVRRRVLRANQFNFSCARFRLAALANIAADDIFPFTSCYQMPDGALRVLEVIEPALGIGDWRAEGGRILTRRSGFIRVRCVIDIPVIEEWDDLACDLLASEIAFEIADEITGDATRKQAARIDRKAASASASVVDAVENPPIEPEEDEWILARYR